MQGFLDAIRTPDVAYLLLLMMILGIGIEILTPGIGITSLVGIISGIFAFLSLEALPVNPWGIVLILLSLAFFVLEAIRRPRGLLVVAGMASFLVGSLFLFHGGVHASYALIVPTTVIITPILVLISQRVVVAQRKKAITGREELKGKVVVVNTILQPQGTVKLEGEIWSAILKEGEAKPGEEVVIDRVEGLKLYVSKREKGGNA